METEQKGAKCDRQKIMNLLMNLVEKCFSSFLKLHFVERERILWSSLILEPLPVYPVRRGVPRILPGVMHIFG
jgi:hypothetical protein